MFAGSTELDVVSFFLRANKNMGTMSAKWWNRSFLLIFSPQNSKSDDHPQMRMCLWQPRSPAEKFQQTTGAKNNQVGRIEEDERNSFTLPCHPSPKAEMQLNAKGDLLVLWLHSRGGLRV